MVNGDFWIAMIHFKHSFQSFISVIHCCNSLKSWIANHQSQMIDHKRLITTVNSMVHRLITVGHDWSEPLPPQKLMTSQGMLPIVMLVSKQSIKLRNNKQTSWSEWSWLIFDGLSMMMKTKLMQPNWHKLSQWSSNSGFQRLQSRVVTQNCSFKLQLVIATQNLDPESWPRISTQDCNSRLRLKIATLGLLLRFRGQALELRF